MPDPIKSIFLIFSWRRFVDVFFVVGYVMVSIIVWTFIINLAIVKVFFPDWYAMLKYVF